MLTLLKPRDREILERRAGLGSKKEKETLDAIGATYDITRERVRQIENAAIRKIAESKMFASYADVFIELRRIMTAMGSIVSEHDFLEKIADEVSAQNRITFLLALDNLLLRKKGGDDFVPRWCSSNAIAIRVERALGVLVEKITETDLIEESRLLQSFLDELGAIAGQYRNKDVLKRWLRLSKKIACNSFGEWGHSSSPRVLERGVGDLAYSVLRRAGIPMHFTEVARAIEAHCRVPVHVATTHNELIRGTCFVRVGRGRYALAEWGYEPGVVRDVIAEILRTHGPLSREDIVKRVLKKRFVKEQTIIINLVNSMFTKDSHGRYVLAQ
jgi:hypothetical protein